MEIPRVLCYSLFMSKFCNRFVGLLLKSASFRNNQHSFARPSCDSVTENAKRPDNHLKRAEIPEAMDSEKGFQVVAQESLAIEAPRKLEEMMDVEFDGDPSLMKIEEKFCEPAKKNWCSDVQFKPEDSKLSKMCTEASTKSESNDVISVKDVEQLVQERNSMIKIAYEVCCMYMDLDKSIDSDHESADSGISEQDYEKKDSIGGPCVDHEERVEVATRRTTRSQSKAENLKLLEESKKVVNSTETMETFLTLNSNFLSKAVLESVKGSEVGDLLNQLERQREENLRLEKYMLELERRRDALKLHLATSQNLIFQTCSGAQNQNLLHTNE